MSTTRRVSKSLFRGYDATLLLVVLILLFVGLLSVYSATLYQSTSQYGDPAFYFRRQVIWSLIGLGALVVTSRLPYFYWRRASLPLFGLTVLMLIGVLFTPRVFGSKRFLFGNRVQPSEVAKFTLIIYAATWLTSRRDQLQRIEYGLIPFGVLLGFVSGLVALQPDIGTAVLLASIGFALFFIVGAEMRHVLLGILAGSVTAAFLIAFSSHAQHRLQELRDVWQHREGEGWSHLELAVKTMQEGGLFGRGPGHLTEYVPAVHNDFILAALGHAFGLIGLAGVVVLFWLFAVRGLYIAAHAPDHFAAVTAAGITVWITFQALVNMGVAVALLPPTGVTLPFVSYGGSSLVMTLAAVGVLLNISRYVYVRGGRDPSAHVGWRHGGARVSGPQRA